ncbi:DUF6152 family protein [Hydrogenophaga sp.]|uniref:DUF6152 family protein n=1 Tax=Hydrogenophaga sp. TaxID=1904254 RepID=UPI00261425CC|nr:DUF6152 family protein [Hydrogenophaga sp.]MCW5652314.1 hypothetical protein [Hydrogenophaga sp.]
MQRRELVRLGALLGLPGWMGRAQAHHGWSSFDQDRPVYVEGRVVEAKWRNPHAELVIELPQPLVLPADLAQRPLPAQTAGVDGPGLLARTVLPQRRDRRWEIELAPLFRLGQWQVPEIKAGAMVAVVGFTFKDEKGGTIVRAEYLFLDGRTYGLRSGPA